MSTKPVLTVDELSPEEIDAIFERFPDEDSISRAQPTVPDIEALFQLRDWHVVNGESEAAAGLFQKLRPLIDTLLEHDSRSEAALDFLTQWTLIAIAYLPEDTKTFVCLPYYEDLFDAFSKAPSEFRISEWWARFQLLHHLQLWMRHGGDVASLSAAEQEFIHRVTGDLLPAAEEKISALELENRFRNAFELQKVMQRYHLMQNQPNEANRWLKSAMETIQQADDFHPVERADLQLEMGRILLRFRKTDAARRYLTEALETYREAGEEWELRAEQAESWLMECE